MADPFRKVSPGQPLAIPAEAWNASMDAARDFQRRQRRWGSTSPAVASDSAIIIVRNDSGANRARFDVLGIDSPIFSPDDNLDTFKGRVALCGITPAVADHLGRFVVLLEPIKNGQLGAAQVSGVCPARITVAAGDTAWRFADVYDGQPGSLKPCRIGSATILWKAAGTGSVWAVVRLGAGPIGTHATPYQLPVGTTATAETTTWSIDAQPSGYDGVKFTAMRLFWSGVTAEPIYQFIRTPTYDSVGRLVAVSAEVRSTAFGTGPCEV